MVAYRLRFCPLEDGVEGNGGGGAVVVVVVPVAPSAADGPCHSISVCSGCGKERTVGVRSARRPSLPPQDPCRPPSQVRRRFFSRFFFCPLTRLASAPLGRRCWTPSRVHCCPSTRRALVRSSVSLSVSIADPSACCGTRAAMRRTRMRSSRVPLLRSPFLPMTQNGA